jgi:hypothetical protein
LGDEYAYLLHKLPKICGRIAVTYALKIILAAVCRERRRNNPKAVLILIGWLLCGLNNEVNITATDTAFEPFGLPSVLCI